MTGMLEMPTEFIERAKRAASGKGFLSVSDYLCELVESDSGIAPNAPRTREELVGAIRKGMEGPFIECTDEFWANMQEEAGATE